MNIRIKHKTDFSKLDQLIESYYEGLTTAAEEREIHNFLSLPDLPERFEVEKEIFGFFDHKKKKPHTSILPYFRWASVAAAVAVVVLSLHIYTNSNHSNYACIDGKKIYEVHQIKSQALESLRDVTSKTNEVEEGFKNLNDRDLIKQQLDVFSGL